MTEMKVKPTRSYATTMTRAQSSNFVQLEVELGLEVFLSAWSQFSGYRQPTQNLGGMEESRDQISSLKRHVENTAVEFGARTNHAAQR